MTRLLLTSLLAFGSLSLAQPAQPTQPTGSAPAGLTLSSNTVTAQGGGVKVSATVSSTSAVAQTLSLGRNNFQECAFAPHVRVLRVGSREVVYPRSEPRICTQELRSETIAQGESVTFERDLELEPGDYVVEVWVRGFAGDAPVFLGGQPVRVTVPGGAAQGSGSGAPATPTTPATPFTLSARVPATVNVGSSFTASLTVKNSGTSAARIDARLCPVGVSARSASGETLDLQNIAAVSCLPSSTTALLEAGKSRVYSVPVPSIDKPGTYTLTFNTYLTGPATATVTVR